MIFYGYFMIHSKRHRTVAVTVRFDEEIVDEIDEIAQSLFSNRSAIIHECLKRGVIDFKRDRPEIVQMVEATRAQNFHEIEKKRVGSHQ